MPINRPMERDTDADSALSLGGRVALVTGAAAGIGRACVERFLDDGCHVVALESDVSAAKGLEEDLSEAVGTVVACQGDATVEDDVRAAVAMALERWRRLDVLVNAAGGFTESPAFEAEEPGTWERLVNLNLTSAYLCCREVLPAMKRAGFGRIVNISSMSGRTAVPNTSHAYSAAKAGMLGLTRSLALEVAPAGITVNAVAPGVVMTPRISVLHAARMDELRAATPVGRLGEPSDIADAVWYLARPVTSYMTGAVLDLNGGRFMA